MPRRSPIRRDRMAFTPIWELDEEQQRQWCLFAGMTYSPELIARMKGYNDWKAKQYRDMPVRQDNEQSEEEVNEDDEQDSTHYWSRYPPD